MSEAKREPESTEGAKDDEREGVADDPLRMLSVRHAFGVVKNRLRSLTSPTEPRIMSTPPKPKYVPMVAAPLPAAPRHPISVHDKGVKDRRKPASALRYC